eukprot:3705691-Pleurochrysis_carterae.AAC.2
MDIGTRARHGSEAYLPLLTAVENGCLLAASTKKRRTMSMPAPFFASRVCAAYSTLTLTIEVGRVAGGGRGRGGGAVPLGRAPRDGARRRGARRRAPEREERDGGKQIGEAEKRPLCKSYVEERAAG